MKLTDQRIEELWDAQGRTHGREPCKLAHLEFARAIEAEMEKQVAVRWLPIAEAPKDQIILLGYSPHWRMEGQRRVFEGRWNDEQGTWTSVNGFLVHPSASHYQLLPAPPSPSGTTEGGE